MSSIAFTSDPALKALFGSAAVMDAVEDIPVPTVEAGKTAPTPIEDKDDRPITPANVDITIEIPREEDRASTTTGVREATPLTEGTREQLKMLCDYLGYYDRLLNNYYHGKIGQEGFLDAARQALVGLGNVTMHLLNLFTTQLHYGFRDFKRSELTEYLDSNTVSWMSLKSRDFATYAFFKVPAPKGMKGTYAAALDCVENFLNHLDMLSVSKQMLVTIENIRKDLVKQNPTFSASFSTMTNHLLPRDLHRQFDASGRIFTDGAPREDQVNKLFSNSEDLIQCVERCIDDDTHFRSVATVYERLNDIHHVVDAITELKGQLTPKQINELVNVIRTWAETFEMYATMINDLQRLNHNLMWVVKTIRERLEV